MKKRQIIIAVLCFLLLGGLTACGAGKSSKAEGWWKKAVKEESIELYVEKNQEQLNIETLKQEAGDEERSLEQQFKAVMLLCELEYQKNLAAGSDNKRNEKITASDISKEEDVFRFNYPISSSYVSSYLSKVNTNSEEFWSSLDVGSYKSNYMMSLFAALEEIDGSTLIALTMKVPEEHSKKADKINSALTKWFYEKPEKLPEVGKELMEAGYFEQQSFKDFKQNFLYNPLDSDGKWVPHVNDGLKYIRFAKNEMIPMIGSAFEDGEIKSRSELLDTEYYDTQMNITIADAIELKEMEEKNPSDFIEIEGKKVIAFYQNPYLDEFEGSPTALRILGDFMLNLSEEQFPESMEQADYFFVLTPEYLVGDSYKDNSGGELNVKQVYSFTSLDLYEASTGELIQHLGQIKESASSSIFYSSEKNGKNQYPVLVSQDTLLYIYNNMNEPERYKGLMESQINIDAQMQVGETASLGNWDIVLESYEIIKSFEEGMYIYSAKDGFHFLKGRFTVTNHGTEKMSFLPMIYYPEKDLMMWITDSEGETHYNHLNSTFSFRGLDQSYLDPGATKSGEIIFEIPDEWAEGDKKLYVELTLKPQNILYQVR